MTKNPQKDNKQEFWNVIAINSRLEGASVKAPTYATIISFDFNVLQIRLK